MNRRDLLKALPVATAAAALPVLSSSLRAAARTQNGGRARLRSAICAYSFRRELQSKKLHYEDLVDMAVENEIDGLDLTVYWFPPTGLDMFLTSLRRKAYVAAVEIPSIAIRTNLCRPEPRDQEIEVAWLSHWVGIADQLGATHIRIFGGTTPEGSSEDQAARWCVEILKRAAEYAGKKGVILGLENHGGITMHAERIIQIVEGVDSPWVGINLDTGNFDTDPYKQMEMCLPYAVNSQFKTAIRIDGRQEASDWERITKMFANAGYKGYMALEYEGEEDAMTAVPRHLKTLRELARKYSA
jgi:sugar phosphate isomerase/epimerase